MHKHVVRTLGAVVIMMGVASSANAQVFNQPVYLSPKHGMGLSLAFDYGRGMNVDSDKLNAYGGRATLGLPFVTVSAAASSVNLGSGSGSEFSWGATASINIISAPLVPVGVSVFAGYGRIADGGTAQRSYPIGAAISVKPPTPGLGIEIWAAPRVDIKNALGSTATNFGISGGLNLDLPIGFGIHGAVDYVAGENLKPLILGLGLQYKFAIPGLGL
ncbi:MAG: hypothetical protein V3T56_00145 [Gemmatimonadales bacterium]